MSGIELFNKSIKTVFQNINEALAFSAIIWIGVQILNIVILDPLELQSAMDASAGVLPADLLQKMFVVNLVSLIASCWVAIAWHRFAILGEHPTGAIPSLDLGQVIRYMFLSIGIGLLLALGAVAVITVIGALVGGSAALITIAITVVSFALYVGFLRLSPVLASVVTENRMSFGRAWGMTKDLTPTLVQLTLFNLLGLFALLFPMSLLGTGLIANLYWAAAGWVLLMVSISQVSIIYLQVQNQN